MLEKQDQRYDALTQDIFGTTERTMTCQSGPPQLSFFDGEGYTATAQRGSSFTCAGGGDIGSGSIAHCVVRSMHVLAWASWGIEKQAATLQHDRR